MGMEPMMGLMIAHSQQEIARLIVQAVPTKMGMDIATRMTHGLCLQVAINNSLFNFQEMISPWSNSVLVVTAIWDLRTVVGEAVARQILEFTILQQELLFERLV